MISIISMHIIYFIHLRVRLSVKRGNNPDDRKLPISHTWMNPNLDVSSPLGERKMRYAIPH